MIRPIDDKVTEPPVRFKFYSRNHGQEFTGNQHHVTRCCFGAETSGVLLSERSAVHHCRKLIPRQKPKSIFKRAQWKFHEPVPRVEPGSKTENIMPWMGNDAKRATVNCTRHFAVNKLSAGIARTQFVRISREMTQELDVTLLQVSKQRAVIHLRMRSAHME